MSSNLLNFSFIDHTFDVKSKDYLFNPRLDPRDFLLFFLKFYSFTFTCKSMIHFWVKFCIRCEVWVEAHFFAYGYPILPVSFVENTIIILLPINLFSPLPKSVDHTCVELFPLFCSIPFHWSMCLSIHLHCLDHCSYMLEILPSSSCFILPFQDCFCCSKICALPYKF